MSKQTIFLVGATGETGAVILDALLEDGSFDVTCFIRTPSAGKPAVQALRDRGLKVVIGDLPGSVDALVPLLRNTDTIISSIFAPNVADQIPLIDAAVKADVKRFVPCNWATPVARGGIIDIRDLKEEVHDYILQQKLGYTIIDIGFWHEASIPKVPSGKFDYAAFLPINELFAGGTAKTMIMDKRDVGTITARIVKDGRTLNKRVYAYAEVLSQNEIHQIIEEKTGEKLELTPVSAEEVHTSVQKVKDAAAVNPSDINLKYRLVGLQYALSKYVREDNTPENAEYLGYINGRELYPDFRWIPFADFVDDLIAGKVKRPYPHLQISARFSPLE